MLMRTITAAIMTLAFVASGSASKVALAGEAQQQFEKGMKEAQKGYKVDQDRKSKEQMRDKRHDNRLKTGKNTSIGVSPKGVNVKKTY